MPKAHENIEADKTPAFESNEQVLLCLTTLHHRRYVEDMIHTIGLPLGSHIRLRYRKPYVCATLWNDVFNNKLDPDRTVLIALAGTDKNGSADVAPIRKGKIFKASCQGDLLILDIALGHFVFESSKHGDFWTDLQLNSQTLPTSFLQGQSSAGTYVQPVKTSTLKITSNASVRGWEQVASAFFRIDFLGDGKTSNRKTCAPFLYYINHLPTKTTNLLSSSGTLSLKMGTQLKLEVHTIARPGTDAIRNPLGEVILDLSHSAAAFLSSRRVRADSSRDVKTIGISTTPTFSTADGHLSIRTIIFKKEVDKKANSDTSSKDQQDIASILDTQDMLSADKRVEIVVARYDFPLRVGGARPWIASGMIAAATALSVYKISKQGDFSFVDIIAPSIVFVLTFFGLGLGLIKR